MEHGLATSSIIATEQLAARTRAYEHAKKAYDTNPLEISYHYRLAFSTWEFGKFYIEEKKLEVIEIYERLTRLVPADALAKERLELIKNVLSQ